jgi:YfiH family protein
VALFVTSRLLSAAGVVHGFSLREGGVSQGPFASLNLGGSVGDDPEAVRENHLRLRRAAGLTGEVSVAHQVHGDRVVDARGREVLAGTEANAEAHGSADALIALAAGEMVGVRAADCLPILLYDQDRGACAAVHSGWRGTRLKIAARGVRALQHAAGSDPARLLAAIGPGIGRCCYEVSRELATAFRVQFGPEAADDPGLREQPHLDLRFCVERALREAGVPAERIEQVEGCTSCDAGRFFSHRREHGRTGRHLAFVAAAR